jgi:hypothetical protein
MKDNCLNSSGTAGERDIRLMGKCLDSIGTAGNREVRLMGTV